MRLLFDLQHPAHLHFFRNVIARLRGEGHEIKVTGRDKDILVELCRDYGLEVEFFGVAGKGALRLGGEMLRRQARLMRIIRQFKPEAMLAIAGTYISLPGKLLGVPTYIFSDTEYATISNLLAYPFATDIYVPQCYRREIRRPHVRYQGYHELAYLHPKYFTPDPTILEEVGIAPGEKFTLIRFVGWAAGHDIGLKSFGREGKIHAVEQLRRWGRVFISSEVPLPAELQRYQLKIRLSRIHDLMAYASLIFGESPTMGAEAAMLGVPAILIYPILPGTSEEQEKVYQLLFNFTPDRLAAAVARGEEILTKTAPAEWQEKRARLLAEKIDVTEMLYQIAVKQFYRTG